MPPQAPPLPPPPSKAQSVVHKVSGSFLLAPGEAVRQAARLDAKTLAWGALALAAILTLSANFLVGTLFKSASVDMTEQRLFTISDGTRRVLTSIDEPINARLYYTRKLGEAAPLYAKYFERVRALLEQYRDISGGKLQLTIIEPEAFSDAEDRAVASGLKGIRLNQEGETAYFGLAASNTTDNDAAIEFFTPDRERFLEYDLTKLINGLANPKKRVIGMMSGIPLDGGGMNPMQPMRQPSPPWAIMEQVREFFEVRPLQQTSSEIPADIDVVWVAQPNAVSKEAAYALDQFVLRGGRILAYVDPVTEASPGPMGMSLPPSESFLALMKAWGVVLDPSKVAGDPAMARRVQFGGGGRPVVTDYLAWLQADKSRINEKDVLSANLERLYFASAGYLTKAEGATTTFTPLIETSSRGGPLAADALRGQPNPLELLKTFKEGGKPLVLAARVSGESKSAFPDGAPKAEEPAKDPKGAKDAKGAKEPAKEPAKKAEPALPAKPHVASGRINVIVVTDTDMLHDQFWVEAREFLGQRVATPISHNAAFLLNALENLSGGEALSGLRTRGVNDRPFDKVVAIRREAERRYREKEQALNAKLKDLQAKLSQMETRGGEGGAILLSDKDRQTIESFRGEMINVRRELRGVQAELRRDIDKLDWWLRILNIAAVPLLVGVGGIAVALVRRRRQFGEANKRG